MFPDCFDLHLFVGLGFLISWREKFRYREEMIKEYFFSLVSFVKILQGKQD